MIAVQCLIGRRERTETVGKKIGDSYCTHNYEGGKVRSTGVNNRAQKHRRSNRTQLYSTTTSYNQQLLPIRARIHPLEINIALTMTQTVKIIRKPLPAVLDIFPSLPLPPSHNPARIPQVHPPRDEQAQPETAKLATPNAQYGPTFLAGYHVGAGPHAGSVACLVLHVPSLAIHGFLVTRDVRARLDVEGVIHIAAGQDEGGSRALVQRALDDAVLPGCLRCDAAGVARRDHGARLHEVDERVWVVTVVVEQHGGVEDLVAEGRGGVVLERGGAFFAGGRGGGAAEGGVGDETPAVEAEEVGGDSCGGDGVEVEGGGRRCDGLSQGREGGRGRSRGMVGEVEVCGLGMGGRGCGGRGRGGGGGG